MRGEKIYISGKITDENIIDAKEKFYNYASMIYKNGGIPVIPFENQIDELASWFIHMRADLKLMLDCDSVFMLSDWVHSKGAIIEHDLAKKLNMKIYYENKKHLAEKINNESTCKDCLQVED